VVQRWRKKSASQVPMPRCRQEHDIEPHEALSLCGFALHIFLATSDLHFQVKLNIRASRPLEAIGTMIRYGRQHVGEVEFSPKTRSYGHRNICASLQNRSRAGATI